MAWGGLECKRGAHGSRWWNAHDQPHRNEKALATKYLDRAQTRGAVTRAEEVATSYGGSRRVPPALLEHLIRARVRVRPARGFGAALWLGVGRLPLPLLEHLL
jgi:hypothetical protein